MKNRIRIYNWREHGDDESCNFIDVFAHNVEDDVEALIRSQYQIEPPEDEQEGPGTIYCNDDYTISDEDIMISSSDGRKFKITITEVKNEEPV